MISLVDASGLDGFKFHSIVVHWNNTPVLLLPLFETHYDLTTTLDGKLLELAKNCKNIVPWIVNPKVLGIGFVEGEWGAVGYDRECPREVLCAAWDCALREFRRLSHKARAQMHALKDFTTDSGTILPLDKLRGFCTVNSLPFCQLEIDFKTMDEYLQRLDPDMRRYLRRVEKQAKQIDIVRTRQPGAWIDKIYDLYLAQTARMDMSFGVHNCNYFNKICEVVPGAEFVLYFASEKIIGFELLVLNGSCLVQKYIGMEPELGKQHKFFFVSWLENLRYCLKNGIPTTHVGASMEELKCKLGSHLIPAAVLFKHLNPVFNKVLHYMADDLQYDCQVPLEPPLLGTYWRAICPASAAPTSTELTTPKGRV